MQKASQQGWNSHDHWHAQGRIVRGSLDLNSRLDSCKNWILDDLSRCSAITFHFDSKASYVLNARRSNKFSTTKMRSSRQAYTTCRQKAAMLEKHHYKSTRYYVTMFWDKLAQIMGTQDQGKESHINNKSTVLLIHYQQLDFTHHIIRLLNTHFVILMWSSKLNIGNTFYVPIKFISFIA